MRRYPVGPLLGLAVLVITTLIGGRVVAVEATGRVVSDWTNLPLAAEVSYGRRSVMADADGYFALGLVPREARLAAHVPGYVLQNFTVGQEEIRLVPGALTLDVKEEGTQNPVPSLEVRANDKVIGNGTISGNAAFVHPGKDTPVTICAKGFEPLTRTFDDVYALVFLRKVAGASCPPLPSPTPASPTPESTIPTITPTPSPSAAPSPTASP